MITKPLPEDEVANARLAKLGCPYLMGDDRTTIWLKGYEAGISWAKDKFKEKLA